MRCPLAPSALAARPPANGSRRVLAGSPIRVGQQAQQAVALPAEQPPASIPASLLEGTSMRQRLRPVRRDGRFGGQSDSPWSRPPVTTGRAPCLRRIIPCLPEIDGQANSRALSQSPKRGSELRAVDVEQQPP